ncbi:MAG: S-adenosylmethionine:tRNA ribosyltransferase-isomerase [Bacteroidales bacterium]|nr:S-adenosylmethionine:tRNA ribosyltransferase-isomerase [Bacteroidales bacterium]
MITPHNIKIADYNYDLPKEKIALFPCDKRENAKLLIYENQQIKEDIFAHIANHLPNDSALIFNNTRVIHARLLLRKSTGAVIEVFCLKPVSPTPLHDEAFNVRGSCEWECFIGNNKRFKDTITATFPCGGDQMTLKVEKLTMLDNSAFLVRFSWMPEYLTFAQILESVGRIPLPPYIKREANPEDSNRYQTVYASEKGSVAAPTAGLHFTSDLLKTLKEKQIPMEYITLHVGAGTFKPVSESYIIHHAMHEETLFFHKKSIEHLLSLLNKRIIGVGTTTVRSLESLYWIGVKMERAKKQNKEIGNDCLTIDQWEVYEDLQNYIVTPENALQNILHYLKEHRLDGLYASTYLMIVPGAYQMKICKGIITNFHQPQSTLLLLISAFVGEKWKEIYTYALSHQFRFLSYGDVCLFV